MSPRRLAVRCVGLIAAYAVALQLLLGAALPVWPATGPAEICLGLDGANSPAAPGDHASLQCCLAGVCHGWAGVTPASDAALPSRRAHPATRATAPMPALTGVLAGRPNWPRAPPV